MGNPVFPGEWMIYTKALQLPYVKLLCDESHGYPNRGFGFGFFIDFFCSNFSPLCIDGVTVMEFFT
jgi:hypothetical protein